MLSHRSSRSRRGVGHHRLAARQRPAGGRHSATRQRGSVLVEAALVLPILALLVFGIVEWGMAFDNASTAGSASRSGARLASARYGLVQASDEQEVIVETIGEAVERDLRALRNAEPIDVWIYETNDGVPASCNAGTSCWRLGWDPIAQQFNSPEGGWSAPVACGTDLDEVGVRVRIRHSFFSRFFGASRDFNQTTVMRLEPRSTEGC